MYILGLGFIVGMILGSFAKAIADRSLIRRSFWGRSYCSWCKHKLPWYDLFPVFSYLILRGKCRFCHKTIGKEYLVVELVVGILVGFLFWQSFSNFQFSILNLQSIYNFQFLNFLFDLIFKTFFITILVILFITDIKKMFIPDRVVIPAIRISLVFLTAVTIYKIGFLYYSLSQNAIGKFLLPPHSDYFTRHAIISAQPLILGVLTGALIAGFFLALIILTRGKGMGGGDVKLGAFMGLALGFPNGILALILSFFTGALVSVMLIIFGKKHFGQTIAFGPFLVLGSLIALFWGDQIINWYFNLDKTLFIWKY